MDIDHTFNTCGATALHFACMRADAEVLDLILEMRLDHDVADKQSRVPRDYFDYENADVQALRKYQEGFKAWQVRWRSRAKVGGSSLGLKP